MANRLKGEVSLTVNERTYTLALDINALAALEDMLSPPGGKVVTFPEVVRLVNAGSIKYMRALIWAALQLHHPGTTLKEAGQIITDIGGVDGLADQLGVLTKETAPDAVDVAKLGVNARPRKAQTARKPKRGGTGGVFTSMHGESV